AEVNLIQLKKIKSFEATRKYTRELFFKMVIEEAGVSGGNYLFFSLTKDANTSFFKEMSEAIYDIEKLNGYKCVIMDSSSSDREREEFYESFENNHTLGFTTGINAEGVNFP